MNIKRLKTKYKGIELYNAGLPNFPRNFTRDSIISGILMSNSEMLKNQLIFCAKLQGKRKNPKTGEELGKIFHEFPEYKMNGTSTMYNACDTNALFLIGHFNYLKLTKDDSLITKQKKNIIDAVKYIKNHLKEGVFYEDPNFSGAKRFSLKVTYWKDSEIVRRKKGMPVYPVAYYLVQVMNLAGIRCASEILKSQELENIAKEMKEKIHLFFNKKQKSFCLAIDKKGPICGINSDILHSLFYLRKDDLNKQELKSIIKAANKLKTKIGYLTLSPKMQGKVSDNYHSTTVWPFEQAMINIGAKKFNFNKIEKRTRKVMKILDTNNEIFLVEKGKITKGGCDPQLWTIAAKEYFNNSNKEDIKKWI